MKRAIKKLKKKPSLVLIDGNKLPNLKNYKLKLIVKGDQKIPSISAASIIAKVARDKMIKNLGKNLKDIIGLKIVDMARKGILLLSEI